MGRVRLLVATAWIGLALIHLLPSLGVASNTVRRQLYGVAPHGDMAVLLAHRGVIFAALVIGAFAASLWESMRYPCAVPISISVLGFLAVYIRGGAPAGPLRRLALADLAAIPLLLLVWYDVWSA